MKHASSVLMALATLSVLFACNREQPTYDAQAQRIDPAVTLETGAEAPIATTELSPTPGQPRPLTDSALESDPEMTTTNSTSPQAMLAADKVELTDEQWRSILSDDEYYILRQSGTERAGTGRYLNDEDPGSYHCAGCGLYLYDATHKFHSGCGWPSFNQEVAEGALTYITDTSHGMIRTEMRCARCDGHMGHVFKDGPPPTGLRHCVNGGALIFVPLGADVADTLRDHRAQYADR